MKFILLQMIWIYQKGISPFLRPSCRFYPTCSHYAKHSILDHGSAKGLFLTFKRLLKCHPFHRGGFDPVQPKGPI